MIISDQVIEKECQEEGLITPFHFPNLQPASYDLTLGSSFKQLDCRVNVIDLAESTKDLPYYTVSVKEGECFALHPGDFVLATTIEKLELPNNLQGTVCGKSSLGRLGLFVENAGFIDPGFRGLVTLELYNCSRSVLLLRPGMKICQVSFTLLMGQSQNPYGSEQLNSHYQDQNDVTPSLWEPSKANG